MDVNGINLNVKAAGSGPAIIALHGFAGSMATWAAFTQEVQREYTVITVDFLGHGDSDSPTDPERYRMERSGADIAAVLDKLGLARACWLGYSMGGRIALVTATLMPDRFAGLVLEGASPGLISPDGRARRARSDGELARLITKEGVEAFSKYWEQRPLFASQKRLPPEVRERIRNRRLRNNPTGLANTLRAASPGLQPPVHKSLPSLKIPVLCIAGEYDHKFSAIAKEMCSKLPDGRLSIIAGAGHAPHIENPQEFNRIVLGFLRELQAW